MHTTKKTDIKSAVSVVVVFAERFVGDVRI